MSGHPGTIKYQISAINSLRQSGCTGYISPVAPQWAIGICSPCMLQATPDAPRVFFYVVIFATERRITAWCIHSGYSKAGHEQVTHHTTVSMVAQAGHPKGWPVSCNAGTANPVWAIAIMKICSFGGSNNQLLQEVATWLRPSPRLTRNTPGCFWPFAVLTCRADRIASKSPPRITSLPAALLRGTILPPLRGEFPVVHLMKPCHVLRIMIIPVTEILLLILSRPDSGAAYLFLILPYAKEGISMTDEKNNQDEKIIELTDERRNRPRTGYSGSRQDNILSEEREQKLDRARRTTWFVNDFLRKSPPSVEALFWLTEMLSYISDDLDDVMDEIRKTGRTGESDE